MLVGRIPDLPYGVAERTLRRELVPLSVQELVHVVLNAKRGSRILNVLIQAQHEMRDPRVVPETPPP